MPLDELAPMFASLCDASGHARWPDRDRQAAHLADMVGNPVANLTTQCRAEPGSLYAATRLSHARQCPDLNDADERASRWWVD